MSWLFEELCRSCLHRHGVSLFSSSAAPASDSPWLRLREQQEYVAPRTIQKVAPSNFGTECSKGTWGGHRFECRRSPRRDFIFLTASD